MRRYTWRPDLPDIRDHEFTASGAIVPAKIDLTDRMPPVKDQGNLGSCTAQSGTTIIEFEHIKQFGLAGYTALSRLFYYYQERVIEGTVKLDAGAQIRDGIKAAAKVGYTPESLWPYKVSKFATKPPKAAYSATRRITEYLRVKTFPALLACLAEGFPITIGFTVYESFESAEVARTGLVNMPVPGERALGGHAVVACGYDRDAGRVLCQNSWSKNWGQQGYFTLPFAYLQNRDLSDDFWTVRAG